MDFNIRWVGTPNYREGRRGYKPIAIVSHQTAGRYPGCKSWMMNPKAQASAHYLINRAGEIFQLVKEKDTAWHVGIANKPTWTLYNGINPNYYTLGIEHECYPDVGGDGNLTELQYQATLFLHKQLIEKYNIPIDREHLIGHYQIDSVNRSNCPGKNFPWSRLISDLKGNKNNGDDNMLQAWQKELGEKALNELNAKGLVVNPEDWKKTLEDSVPQWLFFSMLSRLAK